jgi:hypothetical protein
VLTTNSFANHVISISSPSRLASLEVQMSRDDD